jgi:hypothetical protein
MQAEMELEHMVGMQPALYHRYNVDENDEEDDDEEDLGDAEGPFKASSAYSAQLLTDAISNIDLNDTNPWHDPHNASMGSDARGAVDGESAGGDGEGKHQAGELAGHRGCGGLSMLHDCLEFLACL